jgi:hypothetical protein
MQQTDKPLLAITYNFVITTAPEAYDRGSTIPIDMERCDTSSLPRNDAYACYRAEERGNKLRLVMCEDWTTQDQIDRYLSGFYLAIPVRL